MKIVIKLKKEAWKNITIEAEDARDTVKSKRSKEEQIRRRIKSTIR